MKNPKRKLYKGERIVDFRELVSRYKNRFSSNTAFRYKNNPTSAEILNISYKTFAEDIEGLATALLTLDYVPKRIAILAPNRYEWCVSYLAITTSGIVAVPLDKSLPDNEIESLLKRSEVDAIFYDQKYEKVLKELNEKGITKIKYFICMDNINVSEDLHYLCYTNLLSSGKKLRKDGNNLYDNISIDPNCMSVMLFTSGTTSISKAVALSQKNICSDIYALSCMAKVTQEDTFLSFLPLHHTFESSCTFLYGSSCGITIAFCDGIKYVAQNLKEYEITGFVCVPLLLEVMYKKIQKAIQEQGKTKLIRFMTKFCNFLLKFGIDIRKKVFRPILENIGGKLRILIAGGAPMNTTAIQGFLDFGINLLQGYGLTETSPVIAGENDQFKRLGSVGLPLPEIDVKIDSPNTEGIGEIIVKSPTVMLGYCQNEEATKEAIQNGWFHTGDLGYFDSDGFLFITGRKKDVIVLKNGKNIYPEELEILLNELPYVEESMVYGKSVKDGDYKLCAKIVYQPESISNVFSGHSPSEYHSLVWEDVKKQINHKMPTYKAIREIILTKEPLIKTTTQKIKRHEELKKILENKSEH